MTRSIEVTIRDMYMAGTETVILEGNAAEAYLASTDKSKFVQRLETVEFKNPYIVGRRNV